MKMIPADKPILLDAIYEHERTGKLYVIRCAPDYAHMMKVADGEWLPAVVYTPYNVPICDTCFIRDEETFRKNFTLVIFEGP